MDFCSFVEFGTSGIREGASNANGIGDNDSDDVGDFCTEIGVEPRVRGFGVKGSDGTESSTSSRTPGVWVDLVS